MARSEPHTRHELVTRAVAAVSEWEQRFGGRIGHPMLEVDDGPSGTGENPTTGR